MKKVFFKIVKKYSFTLFIQIVFILLNIYFLTYPPKIVGNIVDLLYDIDQNKTQIIQYTIYLLVMVIVLLAIRMPWRWLAGYNPRSIERDLKK